MAYNNSAYNPLHCNEEFDFDDDQIDDFYGDQHNINNYNNNHDDSEEDTEEASETDVVSGPAPRSSDEPLDIREQMYQDKMANLNKQLDELKSGVHPEYIRRVKKLDAQYKERLRLNDIYKDYLIECVEKDYIFEKKAAIKEYEEKKTDLRENLLTDFEDKRKLIETERNTMELTSDSMEVKPTITRKLRRRPNEPIPVVEKRRKPPTGQLVLLLEEKDIENDLKIISRGKALTPIRLPNLANTNGSVVPAVAATTPVAAPTTNTNNITSPATNSNENNFPIVETRIEDGKLLYERRWFHRGQPVYIEGRDMPRFAATISAIGNEVIWVKKVIDGNKIRILPSQLSRGKVSIKRRAN